jgi:hypothetical protein
VQVASSTHSVLTFLLSSSPCAWGRGRRLYSSGTVVRLDLLMGSSLRAFHSDTVVAIPLALAHLAQYRVTRDVDNLPTLGFESRSSECGAGIECAMCALCIACYRTSVSVRVALGKLILPTSALQSSDYLLRSSPATLSGNPLQRPSSTTLFNDPLQRPSQARLSGVTSLRPSPTRLPGEVTLPSGPVQRPPPAASPSPGLLQRVNPGTIQPA